MEVENKGILYLCPTPIGNLEDMTYRAVRILKEVQWVAAEDTRHTGLLLSHFKIETPLLSYHEHNKKEKGKIILEKLRKGEPVALVSDAGMPGISDPGLDLVQWAIEKGITIVPLPGANAGLTALIASGLDTREFTFCGFLPKRKTHRDEILQRLRSYKGTLIFYEAPHRLYETIQHLYHVFGNRSLVIGRELTKKFETFTRITLGELIEQPEKIVLKGEFVLLVEGATDSEEDKLLHIEMAVEDLVVQLIEQGMNKKEAIRQIAKEKGLSRREVYNRVEKYQDERIEEHV